MNEDSTKKSADERIADLLIRRDRAQAEAKQLDEEARHLIDEESVRAALCNVLDRLGADGACAYMSGDTITALSDYIYDHVRGLEETARAQEREACADFAAAWYTPPGVPAQAKNIAAAIRVRKP